MEEQHLESQLLSIKDNITVKERLEKQFWQLVLLHQVFVKQIVGLRPMEMEVKVKPL